MVSDAACDRNHCINVLLVICAVRRASGQVFASTAAAELGTVPSVSRLMDTAARLLRLFLLLSSS